MKFLLITPFLLSLSFCNKNSEPNKEAFDVTKADYYAKVEDRNKFDNSNSLNFDDQIIN